MNKKGMITFLILVLGLILLAMGIVYAYENMDLERICFTADGYYNKTNGSFHVDFKHCLYYLHPRKPPSLDGG